MRPLLFQNSVEDLKILWKQVSYIVDELKKEKQLENRVKLWGQENLFKLYEEQK